MFRVYNFVEQIKPSMKYILHTREHEKKRKLKVAPIGSTGAPIGAKSYLSQSVPDPKLGE